MEPKEINEMIENAEELIDENVERAAPVFGLVNCELLNVREEPDAESEILAVLKKDSEVMIDFDESTEDFYSICNEAGIEGYCMKQFIEV